MTIDKFGRHISSVKPRESYYHIDKNHNIDFRDNILANIGHPANIKDAVNFQAIINVILYPLYKDLQTLFNFKHMTKREFVNEWIRISKEILSNKDPEILNIFFKDIYTKYIYQIVEVSKEKDETAKPKEQKH